MRYGDGEIEDRQDPIQDVFLYLAEGAESQGEKPIDTDSSEE